MKSIHFSRRTALHTAVALVTGSAAVLAAFSAAAQSNFPIKRQTCGD